MSDDWSRVLKKTKKAIKQGDCLTTDSEALGKHQRGKRQTKTMSSSDSDYEDSEDSDLDPRTVQDNRALLPTKERPNCVVVKSPTRFAQKAGSEVVCCHLNQVRPSHKFKYISISEGKNFFCRCGVVT